MYVCIQSACELFFRAGEGDVHVGEPVRDENFVERHVFPPRIWPYFSDASKIKSYSRIRRRLVFTFHTLLFSVPGEIHRGSVSGNGKKFGGTK